jgi:K+-transporting ATPase KdpF subunit
MAFGTALAFVRGHGRYLSADSGWSVCDDPRSAVGIEPSWEDIMTVMYWLAAGLALFLFGYLLFALLRAEEF